MSEPALGAPVPEAAGGRALALLTAGALLVRGAFLLLEPQCALAGDEPSWLELGRQIGRPAVAFSPLRSDLVFYPPAYPYFIGALTRALGSPQAVLWAQVLLGALVVPAVGRAGMIAFGRRAGILAAALCAFWPELVWFAAHFWSETLFIVLLWWAIERALHADLTGSVRTAALSGLLWGLATLTRELALYLVPLVALWMLRPRMALQAADRSEAVQRTGEQAAGELRAVAWYARLQPPRATLAPAAALVLASLLTVVPWTIRNAIVFRAFIPVSTMGGLNLWQGNTTLTHLQIYEVLAGIDGPVAQDRYCRRLAWETIAARQPTWILDKLAEQMPEFWKPGSEVLDHLLGREACGPLTTAALVKLELVLILPYLAVLGLLLVGLARLRFGAAAGLLLGLLVAYNAAHVVAYATTRFRLPVMPVVFVVAGALIAGRSEASLRPLQGRRLALLLLLVASAGVLLAPGLDELACWRFLTGG